MSSTPRYIGLRNRTRRGDRLVLWFKPSYAGRRQVARRDCPECADGKVEVGHDSTVAECLELGRFLVRKEGSRKAADKLAVRFTDEVVAYLPRDVDWSIDACTIRDWIDDRGPVRARWGREDHLLPPDDHEVRRQQLAYQFAQGPAPAPTRLTDGTATAMDSVLAHIEGDDF